MERRMRGGVVDTRKHGSIKTKGNPANQMIKKMNGSAKQLFTMGIPKLPLPVMTSRKLQARDKGPGAKVIVDCGGQETLNHPRKIASLRYSNNKQTAQNKDVARWGLHRRTSRNDLGFVSIENSGVHETYMSQMLRTVATSRPSRVTLPPTRKSRWRNGRKRMKYVT